MAKDIVKPNSGSSEADSKRKAALWVYLVSKSYIGSDHSAFIPYPIYLEEKYPGRDIGIWHPFPTTRGELQATLTALGVKDYNNPDLIAYRCKSAVPGIMPHMEYVPNLDEVNYLAAKLWECSPREREIFYHAVHSSYPTWGLKDVINIIENIDGFTLRPHEMWSDQAYVVTENGDLGSDSELPELYHGPEDIPQTHRVLGKPERRERSAGDSAVEPDKPSVLDQLAAARERADSVDRPRDNTKKRNEPEL